MNPHALAAYVDAHASAEDFNSLLQQVARAFDIPVDLIAPRPPTCGQVDPVTGATCTQPPHLFRHADESVPGVVIQWTAATERIQ